MKKGRFINPTVYKSAKKKGELLEFKNKPLLNIRNSSYLKMFENCVFRIHTGKKFVVNYPENLKEVFLDYPYYNFKLGQFSYNKKIFIRDKPIAYDYYGYILDDIKTKQGFILKEKKQKRSVFVFKN